MKIVRRYYIKEYLKLLCIICAGLALIFSLLDLVDKIDNFAPGKLSLKGVMYYSLLVMPKYVLYLLPMSLLISSLFIFGLAARYQEITALKASGGRLKVLFLPFVILGLLCSLFSFIMAEFAIPIFSEKLLEFKRIYMGRPDKMAVVQGSVWFRGMDGSVTRMMLYMPEKKLAKGVSIFLPGELSLRKRIEAKEALWSKDESGNNTWILSGVTLYDFESGKFSVAQSMEYPYIESPDLFARGIRATDEMGISELSQYINKLRAAGITHSRLVVDFHVKLSYPLMNFCMMILGLALSGIMRTGGGLLATGAGVSISIAYWLFYTFMLSMGYAKVIEPVIAPWIVPVMFGTVSVYLFRRVPE